MNTQYKVDGLELTEELEKYANGKLARLTRRVPRKLRATASCQVLFSQTTHRGIKLSTCSITLSLGDTEMKAEEATQHLYAALDIAAVHVEQQLKDYSRRRRLLKRRLRTG